MTVALQMRVYCTLGSCDVEIPDFGALIAHIVQVHPDQSTAIEVRPRRGRRRGVYIPPPPPDLIIPIADHLTATTIQELEALTSQANTHIRQAHGRIEQARDRTREAVTEALHAVTAVNERILALHHRLMDLEGESARTRRVTEANAVVPPPAPLAYEEDGEDSERGGGIVVTPLEDSPSSPPSPGLFVPPAESSPDATEITNESLMAEFAAGQATSQS
jgi:hypothetical protein